MNYSFEDYENAIINALSPLLKKNGGYLRVLKGYAGELDTEESLRQFLGNSPAVAVEIDSATYKQENSAYLLQETRVYIYVCARYIGTQDRARKQGVYRILKDIRDLLLWNRLGLDIRPVQIKREMKLGSSKDVVIYAAEYVIINDRITGGK